MSSAKSTLPRQREVCGVPYLLQKKKIKRVYLRIKPPHGEVVVSAPLSLREDRIDEFVRSKLEWILEHRQRLQQAGQAPPLAYVTGDTLPLWGRRLPLRVEAATGRESAVLAADELILRIKPTASVERREALILSLYRSLLEEELARLLPKWEQITTLSPDFRSIKRMRTRWGSCNTQARRLWFNVMLAQKPLPCLEYVVLHELLHLRVPNHGDEFKRLMSHYMPDWKERKAKLNNS